VLQLAETLAEMSDGELARLPLDDELRAEVRRTRAITRRIARKRQTQFLAKQLRRRDPAELDALRAALARDRARTQREAAALHRIEAWRERLIREGDRAVAALIRQFPDCDPTPLRRLIGQARIERAQDLPPRAFHELFRRLRGLLAEPPGVPPEA
jgi:ribosome-associated protein